MDGRPQKSGAECKLRGQARNRGNNKAAAERVRSRAEISVSIDCEPIISLGEGRLRHQLGHLLDARWNSSQMPLGPHGGSRSSFRIRVRCANSISIFLRDFSPLLHRTEITRYAKAT